MSYPQLLPAPGLPETPHAVMFNRDRGYPENPFIPTSRYVPSATTIARIANTFAPEALEQWRVNESYKAAHTLFTNNIFTHDPAHAAYNVETLKHETRNRLDTSRAFGSTIHAHTAHLDAGLPIPRTDTLQDQFLSHWNRFTTQHQPEWLAIERTLYTPVIAETSCVAGTADRIYRTSSPITVDGVTYPPGTTCVLDLKIKLNKFRESHRTDLSHITQVQTLALADRMVCEEYAEFFVLPEPIQLTQIIYLYTDGWISVVKPAKDPGFMASIAHGVSIWAWQQTLHGPNLGAITTG